MYHALSRYPNLVMSMGIIFVYIITILGLKYGKDMLPADEGRDFAVDGKLSKGKPRGAGIIFIIAFILGVVLFSPLRTEYIIYVGLVFIEMMTGYLDDKAEVSWGRLKKGFMDLLVAVLLAAAFIHYNGNVLYNVFIDHFVTIPLWIYVPFIVALAWISINVTNCADGVDGLSGILTLATIMSFYLSDLSFVSIGRFSYMLLYFAAGLLAYLWFNATPSELLMGDAGSRAMGIFIAIVALKSKMAFLYIPFAFMLILDGGLGLFKVTFIKVFKVNPLKNIRTPLHDHVRKNLPKTWSNTQVVIRFFIIQVIISLITVFIILR